VIDFIPSIDRLSRLTANDILAMWSRINALAVAAVVAAPVWAQFPPEPEGVTVLKSKFDERITISYKEVIFHFST
jgi:hypothetical protein